MMRVARSQPADTPAIYELLAREKFRNLPLPPEAYSILDGAHSYILRRGGNVMLWAAYHGNPVVFLDLVISSRMPRSLITKGLCKDILAAGFELSQNDCIAVEAYNPKGIKAALKMGFKLNDLRQEDGWVKLVLTREEFERKFAMRGKPL